MQSPNSNGFLRLLAWSEKYTNTDMRYLAKNGFWEVFKVAGLAVMSLVTMAAFSRLISQETYGSYRYIISIVSILGILTLPGITTSLVRAISQEKDGSFKLANLTRAKWGLLATLGSFAVGAYYIYAGNYSLGLSFVLAGIFLPLFYAFENYEYFWQGKQRFDIQSKYKLILNAISIGVLVGTLALTDNIALIILAFFLPRVLLKLLFSSITSKAVSNDEIDDQAVPFGKHLTAMGAMSTASSQLETIVIWHLLGPLAVAIYSFAWLPMQHAHSIIPINQLALPRLSAISNIAEKKRSIVGKFLKIYALIVPFIVFLFIIAPYFYEILFPEYTDSIFFFRLLTLTLLFLPFNLMGTSLVAAVKKKALYVIQTISPIIRVVLFFALIPTMGITGAVIAILLSQAADSVLTAYYFAKI